MESKLYLTYNDIEVASNDISDKIWNLIGDRENTVIVGIVRGGVIPSYLVARNLGVSMKTIYWQTRDGSRQEVSDEIVNMINHGKIVIFVDDINDTSTTFNQIVEAYGAATIKPFYTASLYAKKHSTFVTSVLPARVLSNDMWVVFPWE